MPWKVHVEARPGQRLIIGDAGEAGMDLAIGARGVPPFRMITGFKPEHGAGGFEAPVYSAGWHRLTIDGQEFDFVPYPDATTWIGLTYSAPDAAGDPAPFDPAKDLDGGAERWEAVFAKLDRIEQLLEGYLGEVRQE